MYCKTCGNKMADNEVVCSRCEAQNKIDEAIDGSDRLQSSGAEVLSRDLSVVQNNEFVAKSMAYAKDYFQYFLRAMKQPFKVSQDMAEPNVQMFGIVTVGIFSFLFPLLLFFMLSFFKPSFTDMVLIPFLTFAAIAAAVVGVLMLVGRWMKSGVSYKEVFGAYGTLYVLPVALLVVSFFAVLIKNYYLFGLMVMLIVLASSVVNAGVLFSIRSQMKEEPAIDMIHAVLGSYLVTAVLFSILGNTLLSDSFGQVFGLFNYLF